MPRSQGIAAFFRIGALFLLLSFVSACASTVKPSDTPSPLPQPPEFLTGVFIDAPVAGLSYMTRAYAGITDQAGTFRYKNEDLVTFSIGKLVIGTSEGKAVLSPIDLMPGAKNARDQRVVNLCVMLQTLDYDADLSNGIQISDAAVAIVSTYAGKINFNKKPSAFSKDPRVRALLSELNGESGSFADHIRKPRRLQKPQSAQTHLERSIRALNH